MVDEKIIKETLTILKVTYPTALKDIDKDTATLMINLWVKDFKDIDKNIFLQAINNIRNKNKYFPSIAEIKEEIATLQTKDIPKAEDEWEEVLKAIHKYGNDYDALEYLKPYTSYIAKHIGLQNIRMADVEKQIWNKKEFIGEYNTMKDREIENLQIGNVDNLKFLPKIELLSD